ncbi:hydrogenase expression/formation protein HypE [candidate division KSB1 bacterium]|nr:hydrogenase expression/formation protein HypE [candidate division KSB1 bacterium]
MNSFDFQTASITLDHGSGGKLTHDLIRQLMLPQFDNAILSALDDSALFTLDQTRLAFTTDSFVVKPLFFNGGDIGMLAVNGTVNDLAVCGATPLFLSAALIIAEGFPLTDLKRIVVSMQHAAAKAGVQIVTGDTKVVERQAADGIFINTTGLGLVPAGINIRGANARVGDKILVSGNLGEHAITILAARHDLKLSVPLASDCAALNGLVHKLLEVTPEVHCLRDPTRGGLATTLNELAQQSQVGMVIDETEIPIHPAVQGVCDLLGFDPLYLANEGKLVAIVSADAAAAALTAMRTHELGVHARIIGEVTHAPAGQVHLKTRVAGTRILDLLVGDQLPRIC